MKPRVIAAALGLALMPVLASAQDGQPPLGSARLSVDMAMQSFESICLDNLPRFERGPSALTKLGFAQSAATGTWFHPTNEISVSLEPWDGRPACSVVFASDEAAGTLGMALALAASATGDSGDVGVDPITGSAQAIAAGGAEMTFDPGVGEQSHLFRALLLASQ